MARTYPVYLEVGSKRVFAAALDWPGWCRGGRDEEAALQALVGYGPRYAAALGPAAGPFAPPKDPSALDVVERLEGNATTDFGAPGAVPASDERALRSSELERLTGLLQACWAAFDAAARDAEGSALRKGPRGGGRELGAIVSHVLDADRAYLARLGGEYRPGSDGGVADQTAGLHATIIEALSSRARGEPPVGKRRSTPWPPRYAVRRSAWHALDHAWEIEDRTLG
ncbi:MAG TPA: hypothetical protein VEN82_06190 [Actinomycetota bacterium]|nr:hypothetical protein [Actinomycetota bacterium]